MFQNNLMYNSFITPKDREIILQKADSLLQKQGSISPGLTNEQKLIMIEQANNYIYSYAAMRMPAMARYITASDLNKDEIAWTFNQAYLTHIKNPAFCSILLQFLQENKNPKDDAICGAFLTKLMSVLIDEKKAKRITVKENGKEKDKAALPEQKIDLEDIKHIYSTIQALLGTSAGILMTECGNLTQAEATTVAACLAMDNQETIKEIIASDLAVKASIFEVLDKPDNILAAAILMEKDSLGKLTTNQQSFVDSLKVWVYEKLNALQTSVCHQYLVSVYNTMQPDTTTKLIQLKECGTAYSNLLTVAKLLINK